MGEPFGLVSCIGASSPSSRARRSSIFRAVVIAFTSTVFPEFSRKPFDEADEANKKKQEEIDKSPVVEPKAPTDRKVTGVFVVAVVPPDNKVATGPAPPRV